MKHRIKNGLLGYECLTCGEPEKGKTFTLSGILVHLGQTSVNVNKKSAVEWQEKHKDIVERLTYLKEGKETEIELKEED